MKQYRIKKSYAQGLTSRSVVLPKDFLNNFDITDKVKMSLCDTYILITKAYENDFIVKGKFYKRIIDEYNDYFCKLTTLTSKSKSVTIPKEFLMFLQIEDTDWLKMIICDEGIKILKATKEDVYNA